MAEFRINVYVGGSFQLKSDEVGVIEICEPYIPSGDNIMNGNSIHKFNTIHKMGTFCADILDILRHFDLDLDLLVATVHLNEKNNKKVFKGKKIVKFLDDLLSIDDYTSLRNFDLSEYEIEVK